MAKPTLHEEDREILTDLIPTFLTFVLDIDDPRRLHLRRHSLTSVLFIYLSAQMAGITSVNGAAQFAGLCWDWIKQCLGDLANEVPPTHDTLGRVLAIVSPEVLENMLGQLFGARAERLPDEHISIDGKVLRGSVVKALLNISVDQGGRQQVTSVNAYSVDQQLVVAATTSREPGSEHACIETLLSSIELKGATVSMDAGNAHPKFTDRIVLAGGGYLIAIKGNNKASQLLCESAFEDVEPGALETDYEETPGRNDKREIRIQYVDPSERPLLKDTDTRRRKPYERSAQAQGAMEQLTTKWKGLKCVIEILRCRAPRTGDSKKNSKDLLPDLPGWTRVYYLSSRILTGEEAQRMIRQHWHVENKLHWSLDVNYGEDKSRAQTGHLPQNLAILRRVASNILSRHTGKASRIVDQRKFSVSERWRNEVWGVRNA